jgi:hypothetical protein
MERERIVGFHFFVNDRLKGKKVKAKDKYVLLFPVYVNINFEQKTTQTKVLVDSKPILIDEDNDNWRENPKIATKLEQYKEKVEKIIRYERMTIGEEYSVSGISNRLSIYNKTIDEFLDSISVKKLIEIISKEVNKEHKFPIFLDSIDQDSIFKSIGMFIRFFKEITVYEWLLTGKVRNEFLKRTEATYQEKNNLKLLIMFFQRLSIKELFLTPKSNWEFSEPLSMRISDNSEMMKIMDEFLDDSE